jgi:hypothetical protein
MKVSEVNTNFANSRIGGTFSMSKTPSDPPNPNTKAIDRESPNASIESDTSNCNIDESGW